MRYYKIIITNPQTGKVITPAGSPSGGDSTYTSFQNNKNIPGARNIEIDAPVFDFASPAGACFVRVWGISLAEISQASDLNNMNIQVFGGMQKGLPLANPAQAGLLFEGTISQAFGNWVNTDMTLDLIVTAGGGSSVDPKNIVLSWKKGTKLQDAVQQAIKTPFSDYKFENTAKANIVATEDITGYYDSVSQLASYVYEVSNAALNGGTFNNNNKRGIRVALADKTFRIYDGSDQSNQIQIDFKDLIGQPTWIDPLTIQVKCVMRADLKVGDIIKMPQTIVSTTQGGSPAFGLGISQKAAFQGNFQIQYIRHVGNFRQPYAEAWNTTIDCYSLVDN